MCCEINPIAFRAGAGAGALARAARFAAARFAGVRFAGARFAGARLAVERCGAAGRAGARADFFFVAGFRAVFLRAAEDFRAGRRGFRAAMSRTSKMWPVP
jgi:hypothetical protein